MRGSGCYNKQSSTSARVSRTVVVDVRRKKMNISSLSAGSICTCLCAIPSTSSQYSKTSKPKRHIMDKRTNSKRHERSASRRIPHVPPRQQEVRPSTPSSMVVEPPLSRSPSPEWIDSHSRPCHDTHSKEDATAIANELEVICIHTREPE